MPKSLSRRMFLAAGAGAALVRPASALDGLFVTRLPAGGVQPQAVVAGDGTIHAVYLTGDPATADVAYMQKPRSAAAFSRPVLVNDRPGSAIALGTVRGAHLALGNRDRVHVTWNGNSAAEPKAPRNAAPMLYTRWSGAAAGFESQRNVITKAFGLDGGGAIASDRNRNTYVAWHAPESADGKPVEGEEHRRVWLAHSKDEGRSFSPEAAVSPSGLGACGCCGMGALASRGGDLYLLFRSARELVHRDMHVLISRDCGKTFRAVNLDAWEIGACPMSTVSLTEAAGRVWVSWETRKQVFFAAINPQTLEIGKPVKPSGEGANRKHPTLAVNGRGETLLAWTEGTGWKKGGSIVAQLFNPAGEPFNPPAAVASVGPWGLAAAISVNDRFAIVC